MLKDGYTIVRGNYVPTFGKPIIFSAAKISNNDVKGEYYIFIIQSMFNKIQKQLITDSIPFQPQDKNRSLDELLVLVRKKAENSYYQYLSGLFGGRENRVLFEVPFNFEEIVLEDLPSTFLQLLLKPRNKVIFSSISPSMNRDLDALIHKTSN